MVAVLTGCDDSMMLSHRSALAGWSLFTLSGLFFLVDAIESGDLTALGSAVTWLLGVAVFVFAMVRDPQDQSGTQV